MTSPSERLDDEPRSRRIERELRQIIDVQSAEVKELQNILNF